MIDIIVKVIVVGMGLLLLAPGTYLMYKLFLKK